MVMDPPFGGLAEVLAASVKTIWDVWRQKVQPGGKFISLKHCSFFCVLVGLIYNTVKPQLTDTSLRQTPLVSGHLVMFSATYKHYIFNLL